MQQVSRAECLRLFAGAGSVTVTTMWEHVRDNVWRVKDIPMRMSETRYVERVRSRDVLLSATSVMPVSYVDVMGADEVWYYDTRPHGDVYAGPFMRVYWSNVAIEYSLGGVK